MAEIVSCPRCGSIYVETKLRDACDKCFKEEEKLFQEVYQFLRKRENRAASTQRVAEVTGASEDLLFKWVKKGRLKPALFPNLGYPCDNCGRNTQKGMLCDQCANKLKRDLQTFEAQKEWREQIRQNEKATYFSMDEDK